MFTPEEIALAFRVMDALNMDNLSEIVDIGDVPDSVCDNLTTPEDIQHFKALAGMTS